MEALLNDESKVDDAPEENKEETKCKKSLSKIKR
jgi:hypothetical protein